MVVVLVVVAALGGGLVVAPALNRVILAWVGANVVVPAVLGRPLADGEVTAAPVRCPGCGAALQVEAGPVVLLPWLAAGGQCRACRARRPRWWLAVELVTATAFGASAARFGWSAELPAVLAFMAGLIALSAVDVVYLRIPARFVYATAAVVLPAMAAATALGTPAGALASAAVAAAAYGAALAFYWFVWPAGLGFGDVRLGALVGLTCGWVSWEPGWPAWAAGLTATLQAAWFGGCLGLVVGMALLVVRRRNQPFAFGPCIALAGAAVVLFQGPLT